MIANIKHLAIIMDGNRRWATKKGLPKLLGHTEGAKVLKKIAEAVRERGIPYFTVWALSTENLKNRGETELKHLFALFNQLTDYLDDFFKNDTRCNLIGDLSQLPEDTQERLRAMVEKTKNNKSMVLTLAINYGGRDEILRAIRKYVAEKKSIPPLVGEGEGGVKITEKTFQKYLDTATIPDPDLIIRTGGHQRLSGWMPWQTTYSELYFTPVYWPAFTEEDLDKAIEWFNEQERNQGA